MTIPTSSSIQYRPLHQTFVAEASGADLTHPTPELVAEIKQGLAKVSTAATTSEGQYGVLVFRQTGLDDDSHVALSRLFGELDDVKPYNQLGRINRLKYDELFDVSNVDAEGNVIQPDSMRGILGRGNTIFHVDSSFNPRRAGYSMLLAHVLPPPGLGGETEFADTRTAYDDLDDPTKDKIKDWALKHSQFQSRRVANPGEKFLDDPKWHPESHQMGTHRLVQRHEPSDRTNLYIANHAYSVDGMPVEEGQKEIRALLDHATQRKYVCAVTWEQPGDLVIWDNTCVMHRATQGAFEGKHKRDMRRTTVHDASSQAWGLNKVGDTWRSGLP